MKKNSGRGSATVRAGLTLLTVLVLAMTGLYLWQPHAASLPPIQRKTVAPVQPVRVLAYYPHRPAVFTQGLVWDGQDILESEGGWGKSAVSRFDLSSGQVKQRRVLDKTLFAEDLTLFKEKLYVLTYQSWLVLVLDPTTLVTLQSFIIEDEGWGLTHDGTHLIASNGTDSLKFLNPDTLQVVRTLRVRDGEQRVAPLNALHAANGVVYANIWKSPLIAVIDLASGQVRAWLDCRAIVADAKAVDSASGVLNGITQLADANQLVITGKNWPRLYRVQLPSSALNA